MINQNLKNILKEYGVECTIKSINEDEEIRLRGFKHYIIEEEYDIINMYNIQYIHPYRDVQTSVLTTDTKYFAVEIDNEEKIYIHKEYIEIDKNIIDQYNLIYDEIKKVIPSYYQIEINMFKYKETYYKIVNAFTKECETINLESDMVLISE